VADFFVTGVGTDIGKTVIGAALCHQLRAQGQSVRAYKPVISGFDEQTREHSDTAIYLQALGQEISDEAVSDVSPWRYAAPLAPNMAAAAQGQVLDADRVIQWCNDRRNQQGISFFEGAGGVMAPLSDDTTMLDWMKAMDVPVLCVTGDYLGAISHTLTALEILALHNVRLQAVIVNQSGQSHVPIDDTLRAIARHMPQKVPLSVTPYLDNHEKPWQSMPDLTHVLGTDL